VIFGFFGLLATEDGGWIGTLPYAALLIISLLQLRFRTLAGWLLLLAAFVGYALVVAFNPEASFGHYGEYAFFIACGAVPAVILLIFRPRFKSNSQPSSAAGAK
jgi:hypothetical protein